MSRFSPSPRVRAGLFGLLPAILLVAGSPQARVAIAYLVPFLILLAVLLAGRYPGESLIGKTSRPAAPERYRPLSVPRAAFAEPRARRAPLLAFAEAGRAPPESRQRPEPLPILT